MCCVGGSGAVVCGALIVPCPGVLWRLSAAAAVARLVADLLRVAAASPRFVGVCCRVFWRWPRQGASHGCGLTGPLSTQAVGCGPQRLCLPPATARLPLRRVVCEGVPPLVGRWWQAVVDCPCDSVAVCCCGGVCPGPALASSGACHGSSGSHGGAYCPHGSVGRSPGWRPLTYVACVGSGADAGRLQSAPLASVALAVLSLHDVLARLREEQVRRLDFVDAPITACCSASWKGTGMLCAGCPSGRPHAGKVEKLAVSGPAAAVCWSPLSTPPSVSTGFLPVRCWRCGW